MPYEGRDYYQILQVDPTADGRAILAAYRWRLQQLQAGAGLHLDPGAERRMREVREAYRILSNPAKRALYDYQRASEGAAQRARGQAARRRADEETSRQRAERVEQRLRAWRQRANRDRPVGGGVI